MYTIDSSSSVVKKNRSKKRLRLPHRTLCTRLWGFGKTAMPAKSISRGRRSGYSVRRSNQRSFDCETLKNGSREDK
jgi:hypothetical protein